MSYVVTNSVSSLPSARRIKADGILMLVLSIAVKSWVGVF